MEEATGAGLSLGWLVPGMSGGEEMEKMKRTHRLCQQNPDHVCWYLFLPHKTVFIFHEISSAFSSLSSSKAPVLLLLRRCLDCKRWISVWVFITSPAKTLGVLSFHFHVLFLLRQNADVASHWKLHRPACEWVVLRDSKYWIASGILFIYWLSWLTPGRILWRCASCLELHPCTPPTPPGAKVGLQSRCWYVCVCTSVLPAGAHVHWEGIAHITHWWVRLQSPKIDQAGFYPCWDTHALTQSHTTDNTHRQQTHAYMHATLPPSISFCLIWWPWLGSPPPTSSHDVGPSLTFITSSVKRRTECALWLQTPCTETFWQSSLCHPY